LRRLVDGGLSDGYVSYGRKEELVFAAGRLADVRIESGVVTRVVDGQHLSEPIEERPFQQVGRLLDTLPFPHWRAYGYVAFETALLNFGMRRCSTGRLLHLVVPETEVRITETGVRVESISAAAVRQVRDLIADDGKIPAYAADPFELGEEDRLDYMEAVGEAIHAIRSRRLQKVILSRRVPVPFPVDFLGTYALGATRNNPARSFLLELDGRRAAGFSPETVLEARGDGSLRTQPLAGTRACGLGDVEDERLRRELLSDTKEVYEHAISVKLAYEEMRAVCTAQSVGVREFMTVKRRGPVQHLASQVTGRLASGRDRWDALAALFPAVTGSGIPKREASAYIAEHEAAPRGLYAGAVCSIGSGGDVDAALVLRSVFEEHGRAWLQAGAGIVEWSDPAAEYRETFLKLQSVAQVLVRTLGPVGIDDAAPALALSAR